jgi:ketosteroid isomerase-like protein
MIPWMALHASDRDAALKARRAWERGDWDLLVEAMHPDVEWIDQSRIDVSRSLRGLDQLRAAYRTWVGTWSSYEAGHGEIFDLGGGRFYVPTWERGRGKGSGVEVEQIGAAVFEVSDGRVVRMQTFGDRAEARAAAGLPPEMD